MAEQKQTIFRKTTMDRISSPEQLSDILRVTNPGIWVILAAVIGLLAGIFAWASIGTLETKADARVIVENHTASIACEGTQVLEEGMQLHISGSAYAIASVRSDEYGRLIGIAEVGLPDGTYEGYVVTDAVHPISFLLESR